MIRRTSLSLRRYWNRQRLSLQFLDSAIPSVRNSLQQLDKLCSDLGSSQVRTGTGEHGIRVGGLPDKLRNLAALHDREFDLKCVEAGNGQVVVAEGAARDEDPTSTPREPTVVPVPDDKSTGSIHIVQYPTYEEAMQRINRVEHSQLRNAESVVAYEVGFACLTPDGKVWTWGDPRYPDCLGRETHLE